MSEIQNIDQLYDRADREINSLCDELDEARKRLVAKDARIVELEGHMIEAIERNCPDCVDGVRDVEVLVQYSGGDVVAVDHQLKECDRCWPIIKNLKKEID